MDVYTTVLTLTLAVCLHGTYGLEYNVDMERTDICTLSLPQPVLQFDVYYIFANPPQDGRGTRDRCTVKFDGQGKKFKMHIREMIFRECQVFIKMYDGDMNLNTPRYQFGCEDAAGGLYRSFSDKIAISLEKPDSKSTGYKFFIALAREDGPDIGGVEPGSGGLTDTKPTSTVMIGIGVAVGVVAVVVAVVVVYLVFVYRRKKEEKELEMEMARSRSTLFAPTTRDGSSVHSSHHSSHHSTHSTHRIHATKDNKAFVYPAFRTKPSISEKAAHCNSLDTLTNSDGKDSVFNDNENNERKVKDVRREFDSMRRGLLKDKLREEREIQDYRDQESRRQEALEYDRQGRTDSNRGLGRSNRRRENRLISSDNDLKGSLRNARSKGRSFTDSSSKHHRDRGLGSTRSSKSKNRSHSPARSAHSVFDYRDETDYTSDDSRPRGRERTRSSRSKPRSASASSQSRSRHNHHDDRDVESEYDERNRHRSRDRRDRYDNRDNYSDVDDRRRHRSRDRYTDDGYDDRSSRHNGSSHRSGTQRSRSQSAGRRNR